MESASLGLASTRELITELIARCEASEPHIEKTVLRDSLRSATRLLPPEFLSYRTVGEQQERKE